MLILGIETSCDETGVALYDTERGLRSHALHSQVAMHEAYGGVVPELASRDHIRRVLPLLSEALQLAGEPISAVDCIAYTQGPGLAGALLVGAATAEALAVSLNRPVLPVHHLEGHLLSPLLSEPRPEFPFIALLVSGGHTQLMRVDGVGRYTLLGETLDDAAGEAFDKSAKLLGLGYPGGPALSSCAEQGADGRFKLPRPLLNQDNLDFSFSGLKTAVMTLVRDQAPEDRTSEAFRQFQADVAHAVQAAIVDVLTGKALKALQREGLQRLVVAGGVGANRLLRARLDAAAEKRRFAVYYPPLALCTDNGAMIAFAGALRMQAGAQAQEAGRFSIRPRWPLNELTPPA